MHLISGKTLLDKKPLIFFIGLCIVLVISLSILTNIIKDSQSTHSEAMYHHYYKGLQALDKKYPQILDKRVEAASNLDQEYAMKVEYLEYKMAIISKRVDDLLDNSYSFLSKLSFYVISVVIGVLISTLSLVINHHIKKWVLR